MTLPSPDQTPDNISNQLINPSEGDKPAAPPKDRAKSSKRRAAAPRVQLTEFMETVSPYTRKLMLEAFAAAIMNGKLDAVTLAGNDITLEIGNLDGEPLTITCPNELVRCDEKAVKWRSEKEKEAEKEWMLHSGKIKGDPQLMLEDEARFDELLALRRQHARMSASTEAPLGKKPAKGRRPRQPAQ